MSKWTANFQLTRSQVKVTRRQETQETVAYPAYTFTYGQAPAAQMAPVAQALIAN